MKRFIFLLVAGSFLVGQNDTSFAQGAVIRSGVEAVVKAISKQGARELATFGGERAVREVLEQAEKEGGEALLKKVIQYGEKYGVAALEGMKRSPGVFVRCLDELPEEVALKALQAVKREPDLMARLVSQYGTDALRIAAKHPGVGEQITKTLGREGIEIAERATTKSAVQLSRIAEPIAKLPESEKSQLLDALKNAPKELIDFLDKHPKVLYTTAGVVSFIAAKDQILGGYKVSVDKDGNVRILRKPGFIERMWETTAQSFNTPLACIIWLASLILFAWGAVKIWAVIRVERAKVHIKEVKLAEEANEGSQ